MEEENDNDEIGDLTSETSSVHDSDIDRGNLYQPELFVMEECVRIEENSKPSPMEEAFKAIQPGGILGIGNVGESAGEETRSLELGLVF